MREHKIGFWSLVAVVTGSQIGSGAFVLPALLAPFGFTGQLGWLVTAGGTLLLALVFARLSSLVTRTGGPYVYIEEAFGRKAGFFGAWTYWMISWISTTTVIIAIIGYLHPFFPGMGQGTKLMLELLSLACVTLLNIRGVQAAGYSEIVFTVLKVIPLFLVPLCGIALFSPDLLFCEAQGCAANASPLSTVNTAALLTMWAFIGVETATAPADSVENPKRNIPKALIAGTLVSSAVYIFNSVIIAGVVPAADLAASKAPYAMAAGRIFGGSWDLIISGCTVIVMIGTLNAWVLTSGQVAYGAAKEGLFPAFFARTNRHEAPYMSYILSGIGLIPLLILSLNQSFLEQIDSIINVSVCAFFIVYLICVLAFLKFFKSFKDRVLGVGALVFCLWCIIGAGVNMVLLSLVFTLSGIPVYRYMRRAGH